MCQFQCIYKGVFVLIIGSGGGVMDPVNIDHDEQENGVVNGDRETAWRDEQDEWASDFQSWKTLVGDTVSEGVESDLDPRDLWMENLSDWSDSFYDYNTTFYHVCTAEMIW